MALDLIRPTRREEPRRLVTRTRMIFLAPVIAAVDAKQGRVLESFSRSLHANPVGLRDAAAERWLARRI
jgi:hypothetical protein